ncbi:hypothetical protein ACFY4C_40180 [Actinomadura viridis]|uniref:hypothetical protein n=1 Tax=Actinomadura viridis TaxID=58110 RepID=UPI0036ADD03C
MQRAAQELREELGDDRISNSGAGRILGAVHKVFFDNTDGKVHIQWGYGQPRSFNRDDLAAAIFGGIPKAIRPLTPLAGDQPQPPTGRNRNMLTAITSSDDLAVVLNATPATLEDANETPRDWLAGIWVNGTVYLLDPDATSDTLAVQADGTAAVRLSPKGHYCGGGHRTAVEADREHWCPADTDTWTETGDARGVTRDWRSVNVWDANGYSDTQVHPTIEEAKAAFTEEVEKLQQMNPDGSDREDVDHDDMNPELRRAMDDELA